ncbi:MAG: prolipoprotein diacylglyceryl transferase [Chloroflexi bacterium]|nr:prolipoprotein diacylglyceryl transferase [Chloroflexota bacterium]
MTVAASDIADALRWGWCALGAVWIVYAWLHRVEYVRVLWGLVGLGALDGALHLLADFVERPASNLPSDFSLYSVVMLSAAGAGLCAACVYARWRGMNLTTVLVAALVVILAGALAGRAQFVWLNWDYYAENMDAIAEVAQGGFALRGALLAGLLALFLFARVTRSAFWQLADAAALGLSLAASIGWYGAHLTHNYYGVALDDALPSAQVFEPLAQTMRGFAFSFVQDLPDAYNVIALRIPVQLMASIFFMTLFFVLLAVARRKKARTHDGSVFVTYLALASAAGLVFGFWRGDATLLWYGLRADQWLDAALLVLALALAGGCQWSARQRARAPQSPFEVIQPA